MVNTKEILDKINNWRLTFGAKPSADTYAKKLATQHDCPWADRAAYFANEAVGRAAPDELRKAARSLANHFNGKLGGHISAAVRKAKKEQPVTKIERKVREPKQLEMPL